VDTVFVTLQTLPHFTSLDIDGFGIKLSALGKSRAFSIRERESISPEQLCFLQHSDSPFQDMTSFIVQFIVFTDICTKTLRQNI
jgi:hypothetical protein